MLHHSLNEDILACFEEALGDQLSEMGTDAAAGREANAESAEPKCFGTWPAKRKTHEEVRSQP